MMNQSILGQLPTEIRLQILSHLSYELRGSLRCKKYYNPLTRVCRQLYRELNDVYGQRTLTFTIQSEECATLKDCCESHRSASPWIRPCFDIIRYSDQYDSRVGYVVIGRRIEHPRCFSKLPLHLFKELRILIHKPCGTSGLIDTWEKIIFLINFFQKVLQKFLPIIKFPRIKIIFKESQKGPSWIDEEVLGWPKSLLLWLNGTDCKLLNVLLQPFKQLEKDTENLTYHLEAVGVQTGNLSELTGYFGLSLPHEQCIDICSLWLLDSRLDFEDEQIRDRLRFRCIVNWSKEYVKTTVERLCRIPERGPDDSEDPLASWRATWKFKLVDQLILRWFSARSYFDESCLSKDMLIDGRLIAKSAYWKQDLTEEYFAEGIPRQDLSEAGYEFVEEQEKYQKLFYEDPERFIQALSRLS